MVDRPDKHDPGSLAFSSQTVHAGNGIDPGTGAIRTPLVMANSYALPEDGEARSRFLFIDVIAFSHQDGIGVGWTSSWAWLIVPIILVGIVFLVSSRAWRAFGKKTRRLATTS